MMRPLPGFRRDPSFTELLIVSRHRLLSECLAVRLAATLRYPLAAAREDLTEAFAACSQGRPALILVDLSRAEESDFDTLDRLVRRHPSVRVIALGLADASHGVLRCEEAGLHGYLSRRSSFQDLLGAIGAVLRGGKFCAPQAAPSLFGELARVARQRRVEASADRVHLTRREGEILGLIAEGLTNKEISRRLSISLFTVKNHVHRVLEKLQVQDRTKAAREAYRSHALAPARWRACEPAADLDLAPS